MTFNFLGKEIYISKTIIIVGILALLIIAGSIGSAISRTGEDIIVDKSGSASTGKSSEDSIATPTLTNAPEEESKPSEEIIRVYVVGCVKKEGVVRLKKGQIIEDAIKAAGGATKNADLRNINLAYELNDNDMLVIKDKNSKKVSKTNSSKTVSRPTGYKIIKGSGGAVSSETKKKDSSPGGKVNINTASSSELDTLPGVGEATAKKIIDYRTQNGKFKTIEDIKKVSGIGDSKFNSMKGLISVN